MEKTNDIILETVRKIESHVSDIDLDMEKDRQRLQDLNIRLQAVEVQLEELRKAINQSSERTKNKVADVVEPFIKSTDKLTTQIKQKRMVILKENTKNWIQTLIGRIKYEARA